MEHTLYWSEAIQKDAYSISAMYKELRGDKENVKKMMHINYARLRSLFILCMTLLNRFPTKDRLIDENQNSNRCKMLLYAIKQKQ